MSKPAVVGPAPLIIAQAIELGILCRPVEPGWCGEALSPGSDGFQRIEALSNGYIGLRDVTPGQIMLDWMLTTRELLEAEYDEAAEAPF